MQSITPLYSILSLVLLGCFIPKTSNYSSVYTFIYNLILTTFIGSKAAEAIHLEIPPVTKGIIIFCYFFY